MTDRYTPAQIYSLVFGATLLLAGIAGFFADASFTTGDDVQGGQLFGLFEVNGWHNLVHVVSGVVLLAAAPRTRACSPSASAPSTPS
ncbi:MAG: DUF4383 domain-containing protein [Actinobacteria bacterium]|nr:DUF4383 domain-containing protein [Actinomycetota bacterium]